MSEAKKVVIIDDSAFMRRVLSDIIEANHYIVTATAINGLEGLEKIEEHKPDIIILDINMPIMNGLEVLRHLHNKSSIPVIVISSLVKEGAKETIEALSWGAFDFILKPGNIFKMKDNDFIAEVLVKMKSALKSNYSNQNVNEFKLRKKGVMKSSTNTKKIIALGCSTGGPKALNSIIPILPKNLGASILVVQHMPEGFTKSLANRLNDLSNIKVKEAENEEIILESTVYIAKGGCHLRANKDEHGNQIIQLSDEQPYKGHRPSVNVMMESLVNTDYEEIIGVILTGMGSDGLEGLKKLKKRKNTYVLAQDEETCVVYGMPRSVIKEGIADEVLPLQDFPNVILNKVGVQ